MIAINASELKAVIRNVYGTQQLVRSVIGIGGSSGIGKTAIVGQAAAELGYELRILSAPHLSLEDLFIPSVVDGKVTLKLAEHFAPPKDGKKKVLMLIDELTRPSSDAVSNLLMSLICERRVGSVNLPDNFAFIATYNPSGTGEYMDTRDIFADLAMARRICQVELMFDPEAFLDYHRPTMNPVLYGFLSEHRENILYKNEINCPRQWRNFDADVLRGRVWGPDDKKLMSMLSAGYMSVSSLVLWIKYWEGQTERMVSAAELFDDATWDSARQRLQKHIDDVRMDQVDATCRSIGDYIHDAKSISKAGLIRMKDIILLLPKANAYVVWSDCVPDLKLPNKVSYRFDIQGTLHDFFAKNIMALMQEPEWAAKWNPTVKLEPTSK